MVELPSSKFHKSSKKEAIPEDIDVLKSDVASFASSLGLGSSSLPYSGFNDSDFRKKGRLKPQSTSNDPVNGGKVSGAIKKDAKMQNRKNKDELNRRPKPPVLSIAEDRSGRGGKVSDKFRKFPKLPLVKANTLGLWHEDAAELEVKVLGEERNKKPLQVTDVEDWKGFVEEKRRLGERLMAQFAEDYESSRGQSGDIKMLIATQRTGTAADKVSAFSVMVGDNPIANLRSLDGLVGMVTSKVGKRHALTGFEVLKELFVSSLLPDRKLRTLLQRPLKDLPDTKDGNSLLLFWYWEECLKKRYERFVIALEEASRDVLPALKDKALKTIYHLLKSKSEQERKLLSALVNKLGDPQNKGASNADFLLSNLLSEHPNMKAVVIDEVDTFLFRPRLVLRAKYHAVNFLSQIHLSHRGDGPKVAKRLTDVYFALFKVLVNEASSAQETGKSGKRDRKTISNSKDGKSEEETHVELDSRILSALLTGINRAFPFVSSGEAGDIVEVQTPLLFQLVHSKNFNVGVQALMLLDKISSKNQIVSDRFYRALYSKLLLPAAMNTSKVEMFIGLLLRAMRNDVNLKRVAAFSKRLLQVALQQPPQYACGYLFVLSELLKARPPLWNMVLQNESMDEELEHFEDIKDDSDNEPSAKTDKTSNDVRSEDAEEGGSSSEEEAVHDGSSSDDEAPEEDDGFVLNNVQESGELSENHSDGKHQSAIDGSLSVLPGGYNPRHREPSYCNADRVSWWELMVLASHAHPSVSTMARTLLSGANIVYNGNPLNDLSLTAFLEKLMEKKPKQTTWHGGSQIEPAKKLDMSNHLIGPELLSLAESEVPPEDLVFHKFYLNKMNSTKKLKKKKKKKGKEEEDAEEFFDVDGDEVDGGDESDNEEIENMLDAGDDVIDEKDGEYDYNDLDMVAFDDDDDLVGDASDAEMNIPFSVADNEDINGVDNGDEADGMEIGDADDVSEEDEGTSGRKKRKKVGGMSGASPFASLEDYEHLFEDNSEGPKLEEESKGKKSKSLKKEKKKKKRTKSSH
ncbi:hypothetical protein SAY87_018257 [Trapa incisa]|uniref:CCAAT-binding factor domain-containing protein n=1 Tax=Trapa incisa TaxID=236973 RepID=A0AAN7QW21_9MYRT|nr:hypothetical protein SAY87_018257 [Trapa incisa]